MGYWIQLVALLRVNKGGVDAKEARKYNPCDSFVWVYVLVNHYDNLELHSNRRIGNVRNTNQQKNTAHSRWKDRNIKRIRTLDIHKHAHTSNV